VVGTASEAQDPGPSLHAKRGTGNWGRRRCADGSSDWVRERARVLCVRAAGTVPLTGLGSARVLCDARVSFLQPGEGLEACPVTRPDFSSRNE